MRLAVILHYLAHTLISGPKRFLPRMHTRERLQAVVLVERESARAREK